MNERDYFDNFYSDEYNLDIKEKDNSFHEQYLNFFPMEHMTNSEFVENFMKIDHSVDFLNHNQSQQKSQEKTKEKQNHNDSVSTHSSLNLNLNTCLNNCDNSHKTVQSSIPNSSEKQILIMEEEKLSEISLLKTKKGRPMTDSNLIIDEVNSKIYDPNLDPIEYKKARKRLQNRESAVRSRQKKKEGVEHVKSENEILKKENYRLYNENCYLKKEKMFLIDQIKFMQNLIKSNAMLFKQNDCSSEKNDIEKNMSVTNTSNQSNSVLFPTPQISLNGERQKPFTKIFSVFIICILSVFYISFNTNDYDSNEKIVFKGGSTITLNDDSERITSNKNSKTFYQLINAGLIIRVFTIILFSFILLNLKNVWICIKKKFENRKKLYKNL